MGIPGLGHGQGIRHHLSGDALVSQCSFPPTTGEKNGEVLLKLNENDHANKQYT